MSRTTSHCACMISQSLNDENSEKFNSQIYSILPNCTNSTEIYLENNKLFSNNKNIHNNLSKNKYLSSNQNYENIDYYTSGLFRPHSCPANENNGITDKVHDAIDPESVLRNNKLYLQNNIVKQDDKCSRKHSKSNVKIETKINNNINHVKVDENLPLHKNNLGSKHADYNSGLQFYMNNSRIPIPYKVNGEKHRFIGHSGCDDKSLKQNILKKPSCGLKYIIFQKLSIMTHFLTGSKIKKDSLKNKHEHLLDENLLQGHTLKTKRSKSSHSLKNKQNRIICDECDNICNLNSLKKQWKPKVSKIKLSDASHSSSGSIDAHAGSPITSTTTVCGNILSNESNTLASHTFCHSSKSKWRNEEKDDINRTKEAKEFHSQRNHFHQRENLNNFSTNENKFGQNKASITNHHSCNKCLCSIQPNCVEMAFDQICDHQCRSQPYVQPSTQHCHYCCCSYSHVIMHPSYSQSPYVCCSPSNFLHHCSIPKPMCLHSFFACNSSVLSSDICQHSVLCSSCQAKNIDRCQSENLTKCTKKLQYNNKPIKQIQNLYGSNQKYKSKADSKIGYQNWNSKHSSDNYSKTTSIPPPPPPPPSSLYSTKELIAYKPKHKRHCSKKYSNSKVCTQCSGKMSSSNQECSDNVQNIIYSHLNNSVACQSVKNNENAEASQNVKNLSSTYRNRLRNLSKNMSWNTNGKSSDNTFKVSNIDSRNLNLSQSKFTKEEETMERRSVELCRRRSSALTPTIQTHKTRLISKTPETYKGKYDRRHKNHQGELKRISKHKGHFSTRQHYFIDQDGFYRKNYVDSLEAGSFIYSPVSPIRRKNSPTVAINNLSPFNIHQHRLNFKDKRINDSEPARKAFQENMLSLREVGWYWGPLSFTEAERLMENKANGTFLVRDSGHDTYFLSLTFRVRETTYHTRIEYSQGTFSFWSQPESHSATTISEFIDKAVNHSQSGKFHYFLLTNVPGQPPMEVSLLYPLTRNQIVHSLKHLSRFVILSNIRKDHITNLNIPSPLKLYLLEKQYYISNFDQFIESTMDAHPLSYRPSISSEIVSNPM